MLLACTTATSCTPRSLEGRVALRTACRSLPSIPSDYGRHTDPPQHRQHARRIPQQPVPDCLVPAGPATSLPSTSPVPAVASAGFPVPQMNEEPLCVPTTLGMPFKISVQFSLCAHSWAVASRSAISASEEVRCLNSPRCGVRIQFRRSPLLYDHG